MSLSEHQADELVRAARGALEMAWAPYSRFRVGAALLSEDGAVFLGCNVENASYGLTLCAERTALVKAVSEGHTTFEAIAVVTESRGALWPCGACRQVLSEFAPGLVVLCEGSEGERAVTGLEALLPGAFGGHELPRRDDPA